MYERKKLVLINVSFFIGILIISRTSSILIAGTLTSHVNVSNSAALQDKEPAIAVSGTVAHLVWKHQMGGGKDQEIVYSSNTAGSFSDFVNISANSEYDARPAIAVGPSDSVHVTWISQNSSTSKMDLYYTNMIDGIWSTPKAIDFNLGSYTTHDEIADIAISSEGVVNIVYASYDGNDYEIWHIDNHTGAFDSKIQLISNVVDDHLPRVAVNSSGSAHVIWKGYSGGEYRTMYSAQVSETTFSTPMAISSNENGSSNQMDITMGSSDTVHFVWTEYLGTHYGVNYRNMSSSGVFSNSIIISNQAFSEQNPSITTDSSGAVHIIWNSFSYSNYELYYANNKVGAFSTAQLTSGPSGYWHERPNIGVAGDNTVMITWQWHEQSGDYEIYFASGEASELIEDSTGLTIPTPFAPTSVLVLGISVAAVIYLKKKRKAV